MSFLDPTRSSNRPAWKVLVALGWCLCLVAASCGTSREAEDAIDATNVDGAVDGEQVLEGEEPGEAADAEGSDDPVAAPPTTGAPNEVAATVDLGDGSFEITNADLDAYAYASSQNEEFVSVWLGGTVPPDFSQTVLTGLLIDAALDIELEERGIEVEDAVGAEIDAELESQLLLRSGEEEPNLEVLSVPFLQLVRSVQVKNTTLGTALAEATTGTSVPCVRHILLEEEAQAADVVAELDSGADFAELAIERSTGPSGPQGGDLGCGDASQYVPPFAEAVENATVGEVAGPVQTDFGWHVILVYDEEEQAPNGEQLAADVWTARLGAGSIEVNPKLGVWDPSVYAVTPA